MIVIVIVIVGSGLTYNVSISGKRCAIALRLVMLWTASVCACGTKG
ncbi:hypothetical protein [Xanthomonas arboricola]|nr:hypothetical protein [Xanthomonas arboricola]